MNIVLILSSLVTHYPLTKRAKRLLNLFFLLMIGLPQDVALTAAGQSACMGNSHMLRSINEYFPNCKTTSRFGASRSAQGLHSAFL